MDDQTQMPASPSQGGPAAGVPTDMPADDTDEEKEKPAEGGAAETPTETPAVSEPVPAVPDGEMGEEAPEKPEE